MTKTALAMDSQDRKLVNIGYVKCPHCLGQHKETARYCNLTGQPISSLKSQSPSEMKVMRCIFCATLLSKPEAKFCIACGKPIHRCPNCKNIIDPKAEKCPNCERSIPKCINCGAPIPSIDVGFCKACKAKQKLLTDKPEERPTVIMVLNNMESAICPYSDCRKPVEQNSNFCPHCFKRLHRCYSCLKFTDVWKEKCVHCGKKSPEDIRNWLMFKGDPQGTANSNQVLKPPLVKRWVYPDSRSKAQILSSPVIYNGLVFYGSCDMNMHAVNQYNGNQEWKLKTKSFVISTPAIYDGIIYTGSTDGKVYAKRAKNGDSIWVYPPKKDNNIGKITANILACEKGVFVVTINGEVYNLDPKSGECRWVFKTEEAFQLFEGEEEFFELSSSPVMLDDKLFVATRGGRVFCIDLEKGREIWRFPRDKPVESRFVSTPITIRDICYVPDRAGNFYAISIKTAEDQWSYAVDLEGVVEGSPSVGNGKIFVGLQNEYMVAINFISGGEFWRVKNEKIRQNDAILSTPTVTTNEYVFYGSNSGYIYCRNIKNGEEIWKEKLDSPIRSAPAISDGFLYVTTTGGFLYAFQEK